MLRRIEDQFIALLIRSGCEIRPPPPASKVRAPDLHHRIALEFDVERRLISGRNVPRKGPAMPWPSETLPRLDGCVEAAIALGVGQVFPDAPPAARVSLYLPLIPIDRG
jgi:hypothetical protein